jgi:hypothetical protein
LIQLAALPSYHTPRGLVPVKLVLMMPVVCTQHGDAQMGGNAPIAAAMVSRTSFAMLDCLLSKTIKVHIQWFATKLLSAITGRSGCLYSGTCGPEWMGILHCAQECRRPACMLPTLHQISTRAACLAVLCCRRQRLGGLHQVESLESSSCNS